MLKVTARVRNGRLVVDEPTDLPEGEEVELVAVHDSIKADTDETRNPILSSLLDKSRAYVEAGHAVRSNELSAELMKKIRSDRAEVEASHTVRRVGLSKKIRSGLN